MMQYLAIISPWANLRNKKQHYICDNEKDFQATFIDNIGNSKSKKERKCSTLYLPSGDSELFSQLKSLLRIK